MCLRDFLIINFLLLCQIFQRNNFKKRKGFFWFMVSVFSPWFAGSIDYRAVDRQNIIAAGMCGLEVCLPHGGQEAEQEEGMRCSPWPILTRSHILKVYHLPLCVHWWPSLYLMAFGGHFITKLLVTFDLKLSIFSLCELWND
jgi:hypothetical protein